MKSFVAFVFFGIIAFAVAGFYPGYTSAYSAFPYQAPAVSYAVTQQAYNTFVPNYKLTLDTTLPGSAYASYPYAAAPTAYGYGVYKAL